MALSLGFDFFFTQSWRFVFLFVFFFLYLRSNSMAYGFFFSFFSVAEQSLEARDQDSEWLSSREIKRARMEIDKMQVIRVTDRRVGFFINRVEKTKIFIIFSQQLNSEISLRVSQFNNGFFFKLNPRSTLRVWETPPQLIPAIFRFFSR